MKVLFVIALLVFAVYANQQSDICTCNYSNQETRLFHAKSEKDCLNLCENEINKIHIEKCNFNENDKCLCSDNCMSVVIAKSTEDIKIQMARFTATIDSTATSATGGDTGNSGNTGNNCYTGVAVVDENGKKVKFTATLDSTAGSSSGCNSGTASGNSGTGNGSSGRTNGSTGKTTHNHWDHGEVKEEAVQGGHQAKPIYAAEEFCRCSMKLLSHKF
ncbi:hypothetical protein DLAC_06453 [Tieghemostelium lacteum]|uniref:Uncharacterized protein n=1 Tax=Tieghemostelium lacteum TaxID=361077 RepID=A0A151ZEX7_TIELA|nr:hypothetical protein DLAC_06453 [Tieghemostelium lacteum]|eukprot:KYQ92469.1 hypothetical protein DLAC_06453 [Tieghemostelium lacteum]